MKTQKLLTLLAGHALIWEEQTKKAAEKQAKHSRKHGLDKKR